MKQKTNIANLEKAGKKIRKLFISEWANPTEKDNIISYMNPETAASLVYEMILAPMGW